MRYHHSSHLLALTKWTPFVVAILLVGLNPGYAASPPGILIGSGQVTGGASPALSEQADSVSLQYSLYLQPDGMPSGNATLTSAAGSVDFDLSSYSISPDGKLSAAGPATAVSGSPAFGPDSEGPTPHVVEEGETLFFSVLDNRDFDAPDAFIEGKVPSFLPPEAIAQLRTILDIQAAIGTAPASIFRKVTAGDLSLSNPPGTFISSGQVTGGASPALSEQADSVSLQYSLYLQPDGTPSGNATLTSAAGSVDFDLSSYTISPDGTLSAAGPATAVSGSPAFGPDSEGPAPHVVEVGETLFFTALDNRDLDVPDAFIEGKVPSFLPPEAIAQSRTILDIQAAIGTAPAFIFRQVTNGDLITSIPFGTLIGSGQVTGGASPALSEQADSVSLQYALYLQPDGSTRGNATLTSAAGSVDFDLSSYTISPDGKLSAAGPATAVSGSPAFGPDSEGPTPHVVEVGETLFFSVLDNRDFDAPDAFIEGKVPSFLPPEVIEQSRTIQEILAAIPPAPASIFRQVTTGDLSIANPPGTLIGSGKATGGASPALAEQAASVSLQYTLYLQPDGSPRGDATLTSAAGSVEFDLTSYTVGSDGRVSAAGPATKVIGSPAFGPDSEGPTPHVVEVGETLFFSVLDNPRLRGPDAFIEGKVPSFLPPEAIAQLRTVLDIQAAIGTAPASIFRQVTAGELIKFAAKREMSLFSPELKIEFIAAELPTEISKVRVWIKVALGKNYQLESSNDLNTWLAAGSPFIAQDEELMEEFDVNTAGRFFRIQELP